LLGAVAASFVFVIGDMRAVFGRPDVTGHNPTSFSYFVFSVGLVEEVAKFLPVIVVLLVTKAINEPIDWVIYGCLSALGFSVWENYSYLSAFGLEVGVVRPFLSTPFHMAMTGAIALSIPEARHRGWWPPLAVAVGLLVVAIVHGTFDFLASQHDATWGLLAFGVVVVWGEVFVVLMASAETLSPLRKKITFDHFSTYYWFIGSYVLLCGTVFLMNAALVEHEEAIHRLTDNLIPGLIAFFALRLYMRSFLKRVEQEPVAA
jgi:RsiW-degrading membrane proteinase PrsW (M82 family)